MEWADAAVWRAVLAHPAASTDERIHKLLYHLHGVQYSFHRTWTGIPRNAPYPEFTEARPMMEWAKSWFPKAYTYLDSLEPSSLSKALNLPWGVMIQRSTGRPPAETTLGDTLLQVAMHSQYHRAQVNTRLKEVGGEPPLVDYIAWLWSGKPEPEWPYFSSL